jgi:serine protease Do
LSLNAVIEELIDDTKKIASKNGKTLKKNRTQTIKELGIKLSLLNSALKERFSHESDAKGLVVIEVIKGGPASEKGIRPGDLIVEVGQQEAVSPEVVQSIVTEAKKSGRKYVLLLLEGQGQGQLRHVAIRVDK